MQSTAAKKSVYRTKHNCNTVCRVQWQSFSVQAAKPQSTAVTQFAELNCKVSVCRVLGLTGIEQSSEVRRGRLTKKFSIKLIQWISKLSDNR